MMSLLASTNVVMKGLENSAGSTLMALAARLDLRGPCVAHVTWCCRVRACARRRSSEHGSGRPTLSRAVWE